MEPRAWGVYYDFLRLIVEFIAMLDHRARQLAIISSRALLAGCNFAATPDAQFWWNWWIAFFTAIGTIGAVVVALFGEPLRRTLAGPRLHIALSNAPGEGEKAATVLTTTVNGQLQARPTQSRWYHVRVENQRRVYTTATEVRVWMLELKVQNAAGTWNSDWIGEMPVQWKDQVVKLPSLTMGQPDDADLCCVIKDGAGPGRHLLQLHPAIQKSPPTTLWDTSCHIAVKLQARSIEGTSNVITVEIHWDGHWDDDDVRMKQHLVVRSA